MKIISDELLNEVTAQAKESDRLRMNYNLHDSLDDRVHRLLNALEPGTYLPPHRHINPDKDETYVVMRGSLITAFFDDKGNITDKITLDPEKGNYGLVIPAGKWHSLVVLEPGTVIFEIKEGPYAPITPENVPSWAPDPSDKEATTAFMNNIITHI